MEDQKTRYILLRDRRNWDDATITHGLQPEPDSVLTLARIPGAANGQQLTLPGPFEIEPSGLAPEECKNLYLTDTATHRVIRMDGVCKERLLLPGKGGSGSAPAQFNRPRGLLVTKDSLYVADSGNGRVQVFRLPTLELRAIWEEPLQEPTVLAADSRGRIYVLDRGLRQILLFSSSGAPDAAYNAAMAQQPGLPSPFSLAIDSNDILYVSDDRTNGVLRFDAEGKALSALPKANAPARPRALAAQGGRLYIADADTGRIWVFDCRSEVYLGTIHDYCGPAAAMALDEAGTLYIKPGAGEQFHQLPADAACVPSGYLAAGPFDAGADTVWERVHSEIDLPEGTQAELHLFTADSPAAAAPAWDDTTRAMALDTLVSSLTTPRRYLWLRVTLHSDDRRRAAPRLQQVQAETASGSYLDYLPAVYRRDDAPGRFLENWLALFRSQLGDWELALAETWRRFDPATTPEDHLPWLAGWLGFELPAGREADEWRELLPRVYELYGRRGTPAGLREFVELYTGVRPHLSEAFRERRVWQLGETSLLGFDTALAPGTPGGMIVPGETWADPRYMGLRGEYYSGVDFQTYLMSRTDPNVDFDWKIPANQFSVRWTGQIQAQYSETYTFYTFSDDGVRLWVDDNLIIDKWQDQAPTEHVGQISLTQGTHRVRLDYYENTGGATVKLFWSSPSLVKKIIRQNFRGEYYSGTNFDKLVLIRIDSAIDFEWGEDSPDMNYFSVRWTGQIQPRYSERYAFHVFSDDGVRLWVDGILIIDQWIDQPPTEHSSIITLALEAGRWYSIQLEFYERTGGATIKLYWSSRSQPKEIIPQSQLFSVRDEGARFEDARAAAGGETVLVGNTVVGQSGPLAAGDFGMPLFSESAHLFTVSIPAAQLPEPGQRQALRRVIEEEKPAHTDFHLCFINPLMRVGFQARIGIDSIVAGPPQPMELSGATLGLDSYLAGDESETDIGRVGKRAQLGRDTIIG